MNVNKGENIALTLQLVKSDGISVEEDATISYRIFDTFGTVELVSSQSATYNSITQSYVDTLVPSASWTTQEAGNYLVVWSVTDTDDDFNSIYTESLEINIDEIADVSSINTNVLGVSATMISRFDNVDADISNLNNNVITNIAHTLGVSGSIYDMSLDVERILGLVHQNMVIDQTFFDSDGNLYSARVRIYRDSAKTNLITTYRITATTTGPGKFSQWEQIEE